MNSRYKKYEDQLAKTKTDNRQEEHDLNESTGDKTIILEVWGTKTFRRKISDQTFTTFLGKYKQRVKELCNPSSKAVKIPKQAKEVKSITYDWEKSCGCLGQLRFRGGMVFCQ